MYYQKSLGVDNFFTFVPISLYIDMCAHFQLGFVF